MNAAVELREKTAMRPPEFVLVGPVDLCRHCD